MEVITGRDSVRSSPTAPSPRAASQRDTAGATHHEASFLEPMERVFSTLRRMGSDYAHLVVMDLRRASIQLAWLVGAGILIAVLGVTAWLAAVVALAVWLLGAGMSWPAVLLIAAATNLVGAGLVVWRIKDVFEHAPFSATLKQLKAHAPADEQEP